MLINNNLCRGNIYVSNKIKCGEAEEIKSISNESKRVGWQHF